MLGFDGGHGRRRPAVSGARRSPAISGDLHPSSRLDVQVLDSSPLGDHPNLQNIIPNKYDLDPMKETQMRTMLSILMCIVIKLVICRAEVEGKRNISRIAVVLSMNDERYKSTFAVLNKTGAFLSIEQFQPLHYKSSHVVENVNHIESHKIKWGIDAVERAKVYSNFLSFVSLLHKHSVFNPNNAKWVHVFEDDIAISPSFVTNDTSSTNPLVLKELEDTESLAEKVGSGFIYTGRMMF